MSLGSSSAEPPHWPSRLALGATLTTALAGLWLIPWFPSQDGPSHVYNAWVLLRLAADDPVYTAIYQSRWELVPNLLGTALLTALLSVAPAAVAEKLLVSLAVVGFSAGFAVLVRGDHGRLPPVAAVGPVLIMGTPLHMGFYSFSLGLALVPWAWVAARRAHAGWRAPLALAALGLAAYAAHALAVLAVLTGGAVFGLDAARRGRWRTTGVIAMALLPAAALLGVYAAGAVGGETSRWPAETLASTWASLRAAAPYAGAQEMAALGLAAVLTVLVVTGAGGHPRRVAWLGLAGVLLVAYAALPDGGPGFWFVSERLSLLPWLALMPLAVPRRGAALQAAAVGGLSLLVLGAALPHRADQSREIEAMMALAPRLEAGHGVLALEAEAPPAAYRARHRLQAVGWLAVARGLVDAGNYEPQTDHFQTAFKPYVVMPDHHRVMSAPASVDFQRFRGRIRYVLVWGEPEPALSAALRSAGYANVHRHGALRLFDRGSE